MNDELLEINTAKPKRTRRSKLDTRAPADFVKEDERAYVAALYWIFRRELKSRPYKLTECRKARLALLDVNIEVQWRLTLYPAIVRDYSGTYAPQASEVAPCCWSVKTSSTYKTSIFSHLNSAAHLAQHFRVDVRDVIREARALRVAFAIAEDNDDA